MSRGAEISIRENQVEGTRLSVEIHEEEVEGKKVFVAYCSCLELAANDDTPEKATESLQETVNVFLAAILEKGTAETVLSGHGWRKETRKDGKPQMVPPEVSNIELPPVLLAR